MLPGKGITESSRETNKRQELGAIAKFDDANLRRSFLSHTAPARSGVAAPREFSLISPKPKIGIDVAQFMCEAALEHLGCRRPQALVDPDQVRSIGNRVAH